jgi:predicted nuclease of predicted toxin-antitoxin system
VRFLLDENISPLAADSLRAAGHDAIHVRDLGLQRAKDPAVLQSARSQGRILISGDTDFGQLLATSRAAQPSVILVRRQSGRNAVDQAGLVLANIDQVASDLEAGAIVVLEEHRARVRRLPIAEG